MGLRFTNQKQFEHFFVTTTFHKKKRHGNIPGVYQAQVESLEFLMSKYNIRIPGFVFMPSHLHLLLSIQGLELGNFIRDFKKYTAQKRLPELGVTDSPIWTTGFDRVALITENVFRIKLEYIHHNPVRAGLVTSPENWKWSSAGDYLAGVSGPLQIWKEWA